METIALIIFTALIMLYMYEERKADREEKKDLLNRLMAKDFQDYAVHTKPTPKYEPVSYSEEDEYMMELEERRHG